MENPSFVRLRLDLAKGPDHLESVAFLVPKPDSFYGNLLRPWSGSIVLELGRARICQRTDKKGKDCTLTITTLIQREDASIIIIIKLNQLGHRLITLFKHESII